MNWQAEIHLAKPPFREPSLLGEIIMWASPEVPEPLEHLPSVIFEFESEPDQIIEHLPALGSRMGEGLVVGWNLIPKILPST